MAIATGPERGGTEGGVAGHPRSRRATEAQRHHLPGAPGVRRALRLAHRAVVGVSHRGDGQGAAAILRPADVRRRRGAQARIGTARLVQPVSRRPSKRQVAHRFESHQQDQTQPGAALWKISVARSRRKGSAGLFAERGHGRREALRRGRGSLRRLFLSVQGIRRWPRN